MKDMFMMYMKVGITSLHPSICSHDMRAWIFVSPVHHLRLICVVLFAIAYYSRLIFSDVDSSYRQLVLRHCKN